MQTNEQFTMNFNAPTATSAPTISSSAMLVELSISVWAASKLDRAVSKEVAATKRAKNGTAKVTKKLLGDSAELDALQKFAANVRNAHYNSTMPWSDMGPRLLPTAKFFAYQKMFTALETEFNRMTESFLNSYDLEVSQVQASLGDLFDVRDYPSVDDIRRKFRFKINYIPLPDAGDWRLDIANEAQAQLKAQYEAHYKGQLEGAMRDIWQRLFDTLTVLSRQLSDQTEDGKTPKIFTSVFDRALEVIDLMESCNMTGDPTMQLMQRKLAQTFRGVTVEAVKDDAYLRRETKKSIDDVIKSLPSLDL